MGNPPAHTHGDAPLRKYLTPLPAALSILACHSGGAEHHGGHLVNLFVLLVLPSLNTQVVLNTVVTMFAEYCETPFEVEPVEVTDALGAKTGARAGQPSDLESLGWVNPVGSGTRLAPSGVRQGSRVAVASRVPKPRGRGLGQ